MPRLMMLLSLLALALGCAGAATVSGKIVGTDGKPIPGANVSLTFYLAKERKTFVLVSDAEGGYAVEIDLTNRRSNTLQAMIVAYAPGYALAGDMLVKETGNVITLDRGESISGTVVDAKGKPLAGIPVRLYHARTATQQYAIPPEEWRTWFIVNTAADGSWTLSGIPQGGTAVIALNDDRYVREQQEIKLTPGVPAPPVKFTVQPGGTISGRLLDPQGAPVVGGQVAAYQPNSRMTSATYNYTVTVVDGGYRLPGLTAGKYILRAYSEKEEWIADPLTDFIVAPGEQTAPDLHVRIGAVLEGTVVDAETGKPVPGGYLMFTTNQGPEGQSQRQMVNVDGNGHFFRRLLPGQGTVSVDAPADGYLKSMDTAAVPVDLQEGKTVTLTLKVKKGLTVTGTAVDEAGNPAAGVSFYINIRCGQCEDGCRNDTFVPVKTDDQGHFTANGLPAGKGRLNIAIDSDKPADWDMPRPLEIEVPAKAPIMVTVKHRVFQAVTGRVIDTKGQPLAGVQVTCSVKFEDGVEAKTMTDVTGVDGRYTLLNIPAGVPVTLRAAEKAGYRQLLAGTLANGGTATIADAVMAACTATVRGTVQDADGKPVAGATVVSAEGGLAARTTSDETGAFTLTAQPADGELHLVAATPTGGGLGFCTGNTAGVVITCLPGLVAKPVDLKLAQELLLADSQWPEGQRQFNRAETLRMIADIDFELASRLAQDGEEPAPPGLQAYLLGKLAERDPAAAARDGAAMLEKIEPDNCKLYAAVELGAAMVKVNPALAEQCYQVAKEIYDRSPHDRQSFTTIDGLGMFGDISLRVFTLAGLLNKADDAEAMLAPLNAQIKKDDGMSYIILDPLMEAAGRVSPEFVIQLYDKIDSQFKSGHQVTAIRSMAQQDPEAAQGLLTLFTARMPDDRDGTLRLTGPLQILGELAKRDPAAAKAYAEKLRYIGPTPMLVIAPYLPAAETRALILDMFANEGNRTIQNLAKANAIDAELAKELYAKYRQTLEAQSTNFSGRGDDGSPVLEDRIQYAYLISSIDPVEARLILETEYARAQAMTQNQNDRFILQFFPQAMCSLDLNRAQGMLEEFQPEGGRNRQFFQGRMMQFILMTWEKRVSGTFF